MTECHDTCSNEESCYAQWTDSDGIYRASDCGHYWEMAQCANDGLDQIEDECEYFECEVEHGGDCWVEKCNIDVECKEYTCTQWDFHPEKRVWGATNCVGEYDLEKFHDLFYGVSHYKETWDVLEKMFCEEGNENCIEDTINGLMKLTDIELIE